MREEFGTGQGVRAAAPEPRGRPAYFTRRAASAYLAEVWGVERATTTLAQMAARGEGPRFLRVGRKPYYKREVLDAWARELFAAAAAVAAARAAVDLDEIDG